MLEKFLKWRDDNLPYLKTVKTLLCTELPDSEEEIIKTMRLVEAHYARLGCFLAEANGWLDVETMVCFTQSEIKTVKEREIIADGILAPIRETRDKVETLLRAIELRINACQSILKQQRGERKMS